MRRAILQGRQWVVEGSFLLYPFTSANICACLRESAPQREMNDPPLPRRHRTELVWRPGPAYVFRGDGRRGTQLLNSQRALILAIEANLLMLARRQPQHLESQQFQSAQQFSPAIEQQGRVGPGEIHQNLRLLPVAVFRQRWIYDDPVLQPKSAVRHYGLQKLINLFCGSEFVGNGHEIQLSALSRQLSAGPMQGLMFVAVPRNRNASLLQLSIRCSRNRRLS